MGLLIVLSEFKETPVCVLAEIYVNSLKKQPSPNDVRAGVQNDVCQYTNVLFGKLISCHWQL